MTVHGHSPRLPDATICDQGRCHWSCGREWTGESFELHKVKEGHGHHNAPRKSRAIQVVIQSRGTASISCVGATGRHHGIEGDVSFLLRQRYIRTGALDKIYYFLFFHWVKEKFTSEKKKGNCDLTKGEVQGSPNHRVDWGTTASLPTQAPNSRIFSPIEWMINAPFWARGTITAHFCVGKGGEGDPRGIGGEVEGDWRENPQTEKGERRSWLGKAKKAT